MKNSRKRSKRIVASALTALFIAQQSMLLSVVASDITGVTGNNGVYNINPSTAKGDIGFRHYENFNLSKGDIANLIYKYGATDIETFVNMVDNQININGLVNTMRNNNFYNGKAVFISPNGMVVGASGVLNVGSLGVYTPNSTDYNNFNKEDPTIAGLNNLTKSDANGAAPVTINGKVISSGDVEIIGGKVDIGKNAGIIGGVNKSQMKALTSDDQATALFNNLVNTNNLTNGSQFISDEAGQIRITSQGGVNVAGNIINYATGGDYTNPNNSNYSGIKILSHNSSTPNGDIISSGINVSGTIANAKGLVQLDNNGGDIDISGNIKNNGTTNIYNTPYALYSDSSKNEKIAQNSGLKISGNIDTKGDLNIENRGGKGLNISGNINHDGDANISNGYTDNDIFGYDGNNSKVNTGALDISGDVNISGNSNIINYEHGVDGLNVTGTVKTGGDATYTNHGKAGLNIKDNGSISSNNLAMLNTGAGGLNISGAAKNNKTATVTNKAGDLTIGGTFVNGGNATFTNDGNQFNISGTVTNKLTDAEKEFGTINMVNNGEGGFVIENSGNVNAESSNLSITNNAGNLDIFVYF